MDVCSPTAWSKQHYHLQLYFTLLFLICHSVSVGINFQGPIPPMTMANSSYLCNATVIMWKSSNICGSKSSYQRCPLQAKRSKMRRLLACLMVMLSHNAQVCCLYKKLTCSCCSARNFTLWLVFFGEMLAQGKFCERRSTHCNSDLYDLVNTSCNTHIPQLWLQDCELWAVSYCYFFEPLCSSCKLAMQGLRKLTLPPYRWHQQKQMAPHQRQRRWLLHLFLYIWERMLEAWINDLGTVVLVEWSGE